jgi:hypothetical protein
MSMHVYRNQKFPASVILNNLEAGRGGYETFDVLVGAQVLGVTPVTKTCGKYDRPIATATVQDEFSGNILFANGLNENAQIVSELHPLSTFCAVGRMKLFNNSEQFWIYRIVDQESLMASGALDAIQSVPDTNRELPNFDPQFEEALMTV